jgi:prophage regulatory protein
MRHRISETATERFPASASARPEVSRVGKEPLPPVLRLPAVLLATGLGRSTVYRMIAERTFPAPVKLAKRAVGWRQDDVRSWTAGRPSTSR